MSAPRGNEFWKSRSKHGRNFLFATPEKLWNAACEFFEWCDDNPWLKKDFKGKDCKEVDLPTQRPYTLSGLCFYLHCSESYFRQFKSEQTGKDHSEGFLTVIEDIEAVIYTQKFEGAVVGAFNANIIARELGLADNQNIKHDVSEELATRLANARKRLSKPEETDSL
ncbi:DNA-packaging protein [Pelagicoccus sp. SDUM812003]|uniref:DNA-packaging protein n=1 Tax=Pelagicoccus sp. SDUM812003 TaxID=3041267 RepID=UPI00280F91F8|nr:DNA-packaging protein [Pelagicoccus sp. SDUM812003]MDQ8202789.1 DNA-packaging protein [Pelagicoccus sp. SDUM812003]